MTSTDRRLQSEVGSLDQVERLAAELHHRWAQQREQPCLVDDGRGGRIDLASTPFAALPAAWQAENLAAARAALRAVAATADKSDPVQRLEAVAVLVHEDWVQRNAARGVSDDLLMDYEQLPEEQRDKDRVIARLALGCG